MRPEDTPGSLHLGWDNRSTACAAEHRDTAQQGAVPRQRRLDGPATVAGRRRSCVARCARRRGDHLAHRPRKLDPPHAAAKPRCPSYDPPWLEPIAPNCVLGRRDGAGRRRGRRRHGRGPDLGQRRPPGLASAASQHGLEGLPADSCVIAAPTPLRSLGLPIAAIAIQSAGPAPGQRDRSLRLPV